jgi:hypothetical protein
VTGQLGVPTRFANVRTPRQNLMRNGGILEKTRRDVRGGMSEGCQTPTFRNRRPGMSEGCQTPTFGIVGQGCQTPRMSDTHIPESSARDVRHPHSGIVGQGCQRAVRHPPSESSATRLVCVRNDRRPWICAEGATHWRMDRRWVSGIPLEYLYLRRTSERRVDGSEGGCLQSPLSTPRQNRLSSGT